jgi:hypothetical protein
MTAILPGRGDGTGQAVRYNRNAFCKEERRHEVH